MTPPLRRESPDLGSVAGIRKLHVKSSLPNPLPPYSVPSWKSSHARVALLSSDHPRLTAELNDRVADAIQKYASMKLIDLAAGEIWHAIWEQFDLVCVLGGDGSILRAARWMAYHQRPVLGINLGNLGFLAAVDVEAVEEAMQLVAQAECQIVNHLMFQCRLVRDGKTLTQTLGLNEMAVMGGRPFRMVEMDLLVDGELATRYCCDGLIVSSPVGSTAHNLSAGGPILRQDLDVFVISAISPHTLTVRPVVDSAHRVFEVKLSSANAGTTVLVDGEELHQVQPEDRIIVERAESRFQLIEIEGRGYYPTLREKLGWDGQMRGRKFRS